MLYSKSNSEISQVQKQWKIEFPLNNWLKTNKLNSNLPCFAYPHEANKAGFYSKTDLKVKFHLKVEDQSDYDAFVPTGRIMTCVGLMWFNQPYLSILEDKGDFHFNHYAVPSDYFVYYSLKKLKSLNSSFSSLIQIERGEREYIPPYDVQFENDVTIGKNKDLGQKIDFSKQKKTDLSLTIQSYWWEGINIPKYISVHKVNYILSKLNWAWIWHRKRKVPLMAKFIRNIIGRKYRTTLKWMEEVGLIVCDHLYQKGKKCFYYWLGDKIKDKGYMRVYASPTIAKAHRRMKIELNPTQQRIKDQMDYISIQEQEALTHCIDRSQQYGVETIKNKDWRAESDVNGRLHTNISNLNRKSRQYLLIDGEPVAEVDISNSQALLLAKLAADEQLEGANELLDLCQKGQFYEMFEGEREKNKHKVITELLFGKYAYTHKSTVCQQFNKRLPVIYNWLIEKKKKNYKNIAYQLQRMEAKLMLTGVCNELMDNNIHHHPIFDGIICRRSQVQQVVKTIRKVFAQNNLKPHLKVKGLK